MDPASAIIGIVSFGFEVFKKINEVRKAIKDAPDNLCSLENSCLLIELSLDQLQTMGVVGLLRLDATRFERLCDSARRHLRDVEVIVDKVTVVANDQDSQTGRRSIRKIKWLMKKDDLNDIARKLKELRVTLALLVIMMHSYVVRSRS